MSQKPKFHKVSSIIFETNPDGKVNPFPIFVMGNGEYRKQVSINGEQAWVTHPEYKEMEEINKSIIESERLRRLEEEEKSKESDKPAPKKSPLKVSKKEKV